MTEELFAQKVQQYATLMQWRWAHFRPARTARGWRTTMQGDIGFPDLVLLRPPRLLFVELKTARGATSIHQDAWLSDLAAVEPVIECYLWRPEDWPVIEVVLSRGRR